MPQKPTSQPPDHDPLPGFETVPEPAPVEAVEVMVEKREPNVFGAMTVLRESIILLGKANEAAGLVYGATLPEESKVYQKLVRDLKGAHRVDAALGHLEGVKKSVADTRRDDAKDGYLTALSLLTGEDVSADDLTFKVAYKKFLGLYGEASEKGQQARSSAVGKLDRKIRKHAETLPIDIFYDPNVTVYTTSFLKNNEGYAPWPEVAGKIGLSTVEAADPAEFPLYASALERMSIAHEPMLTGKETKLVKSLTDGSLQAAYEGTYRSKKNKLEEPSDEPLTLEDIHLQATIKAQEIERQTYMERTARAGRRVAQLRAQWNLLDRLRSGIEQETGAVFELTSRDVDAVRREILPDYVDGILNETKYDPNQKDQLMSELTRALFSPNEELAKSTVGRLLSSVDDRARAIEDMKISFSDAPLHIGRASVSWTASRK